MLMEGKKKKEKNTNSPQSREVGYWLQTEENQHHFLLLSQEEYLSSLLLTGGRWSREGIHKEDPAEAIHGWEQNREEDFL